MVKPQRHHGRIDARDAAGGGEAGAMPPDVTASACMFRGIATCVIRDERKMEGIQGEGKETSVYSGR